VVGHDQPKRICMWLCSFLQRKVKQRPSSIGVSSNNIVFYFVCEPSTIKLLNRIAACGCNALGRACFLHLKLASERGVEVAGSLQVQ
jgi:hypothetical protein